MRRILEMAVTGVNKHLRDEVSKMSLVQLLRNSHPVYRRDYANELQREGLLTEDEAAEFTRVK